MSVADGLILRLYVSRMGYTSEIAEFEVTVLFFFALHVENTTGNNLL
jgi:hypothetical protein